MRIRFIIATIACLIATSSSAAIPSEEMRERNYGGSCGYASATTLLRVEGFPQSAAVVRKQYGGGVSLQALARVIHRRGFNVRANFRGDVRFLELYHTAVIDFGSRHAVVFCGFYNGGKFAVVSDPNRKRLKTYSKDEFVRIWRRSGGRAVAIKLGD